MERLRSGSGRGGRTGLVVGGLLVAAAAAAGGYFVVVRQADGGKGKSSASEMTEGSRPARAETFRVDVESDPSNALLELDGAPVGSGYLRRDLPKGPGQRLPRRRRAVHRRAAAAAPAADAADTRAAGRQAGARDGDAAARPPERPRETAQRTERAEAGEATQSAAR
jgi:hypothetical protein